VSDNDHWTALMLLSKLISATDGDTLVVTYDGATWAAHINTRGGTTISGYAAALPEALAQVWEKATEG